MSIHGLIKTGVLFIGLTSLSIAAEVALPENNTPVGDPDAGSGKAMVCAACHGADGNGIATDDSADTKKASNDDDASDDAGAAAIPPGNTMPKLAGQSPRYIYKQIHDFRGGPKGSRYNAVMYPFAMSVSDEDLADIAAYYHKQEPTTDKAEDAEAAARGKELYFGGNLEKGITACAACHGPNGRGNDPAKFPSLAGQHKIYTVNQLKDYKSGKRSNGQLMAVVVKHLSEQDMEDLAEFIQTLK